MKEKLGVEPIKPLADYLPNATPKAKDLATAMTIEKTRQNNLAGKMQIRDEHITNNQNVRGALTKTDIYSESLPAAEEKKIEAKHRKEKKALQKNIAMNWGKRPRS